jgi:uncharacterized protein YkwD
MRRWLALPIALALFVPAGCDVLAEPSADLPVDPPAAYVELLDAVNAARAVPRMCGDQTFGATAPVAWDGRLEHAAQRHTVDMVAHGNLAHTGSDGSTVGDRVTRAGYQWRRVGENIARAGLSGPEVVELWLASPGHCANVMHPGYVEMGVAGLDGYWTQVFGRPM